MEPLEPEKQEEDTEPTAWRECRVGVQDTCVLAVLAQELICPVVTPSLPVLCVQAPCPSRPEGQPMVPGYP